MARGFFTCIAFLAIVIAAGSLCADDSNENAIGRILPPRNFGETILVQPSARTDNSPATNGQLTRLPSLDDDEDPAKYYERRAMLWTDSLQGAPSESAPLDFPTVQAQSLEETSPFLTDYAPFELARPYARRPRTTASPSQQFNPKLTIGARSWLTMGDAQESIAGTVGPPYCPTERHVDILSELIWNDIEAVVAEINAELLVMDRWILHVDIGIGGIEQGTFDDYDYCESGRQAMFSYTHHPVSDGDILYFNLDVGYRVYQRSWCAFDLLVGHQSWTEKYVASDGVDVYPGTRTTAFQGRRVITQEFQWQSLRVGGRARLQWVSRAAINVRCLLIPYSDFRLEDIHHLRDDLRQDPSFTDYANGGFGVAADAVLSCRLWRGLHVDVGYQLFYQESDDGIAFSHTTLGDGRGIFNGADLIRHGILIGGHWEF